MPPTPLRLIVIIASVAVVAATTIRDPQAASRQAQTPPLSVAPAAVLTQYCVTCHNARLKTAGLVIDPAEAAHAGTNPEMWEKVVRKLRSSAMPPAGVPRPDQATYDAVSTFLETELDRAASAKPTPGALPLVHRLSRTEYQNVIRDLLAIDTLPKEMDYSLLLPPDNVSSGFDNIADLLFVSPSTMERYLDAARKISRLAVGDPEMPPLVNIHRLLPEQWQDARVDELAPGTRGGLAIRHYFPVDADYLVKIDVAGAPREPHQIEVTVDDERVQLTTIGANGRGGRGRGRGAADRPLELRIPVKAGARLVGVTFIEHNQARDEDTLRPRMRSRGTLPALASVTFSGPYDVKGPGDTPSRRRIFVCGPSEPSNRAAMSLSSLSRASSSDESACATRILSTLVRRAYRRPGTDEDVQRLMPFYTAGRTEGGFDRGIQKALERLLVSPQFLFRI